MRRNFSDPNRQLESRMREDRYHERTGRFVLCAFYTGLLHDGSKSPGYFPTNALDRRPIAYVVPITVLKERNIRGQVDQLVPSDGDASQAAWAREYVRQVIIDNKGYSDQELLKDFYVKVPFPFWSATSGVLVPKAGLEVSYASVPDGVTADDIARNKLLDRKTPLQKRREEFKSRYGTPENGQITMPYVDTQEQFPKAGDKWF